MDKRVIKTRRRIKDGVIQLYGTQPLENYPVAFLCKEIDLNRTTFYIHYSCIDDVIEDIADETLRQLKSLLKDKMDRPNLLAETLINYIEANKKVIRLVVNESKLKWINGAMDTFKDLIKESPTIKSIYDKSKKEYTINFVIYGCYGFISKWVQGDYNEEKGLVIKKLVRFLRTGE